MLEKLQNIYAHLVDLFMMKNIEILIDDLLLEQNLKIYLIIGNVQFVE
jgi:hypothetical protein